LARKILLADDSVTAQNMGRRILSDAGYDVTTVNNGSAALKRIAESKPDLIVLDVYMPGYGGLEVCQRLREAPETARIPVLLTVGKLEPFKADEARRVKADGFIVKPFEASELLTALTKLEDKIVPQSQPAKPSRFAKAMAGAEEFASGKEYGDSETGWKNRLPTPPPHAKARAPIAAQPPVEASFSEEVSSEQPQMTSGLEEALLSSMPQDITPEEIASIKAAGAALSASDGESSFKMQSAREEGSTGERVAENIPEPEREESVAGAEQTTIANEESKVPTGVPAMAVTESTDTTSAQVEDEEKSNLADEEVSAALASLAPANDLGTLTPAAEEAADEMEADRLPVTMAAAAGSTQEFSGPRWIAELVPLSEDEATLALSEEMEKAYAAYAAADASRMHFAGSTDSHTSVLVAEERSAAPEPDSVPAESHSNFDNVESQPEEPTTITASNEEFVAPETQLSNPAASPADAVSESAACESENVSAYAAAASAGSSTAEAPSYTEYTPIPAKPAENSAPAPDSSEGESEHATAWANWKQIRESVIGSQLSSQIADTAADMQASVDSGEPPSQIDASQATADESSEISNIVDSVLADLKPRLMAEIAKKMSKDKK
jgi:CheY-like chemotaxis protein